MSVRSRRQVLSVSATASTSQQASAVSLSAFWRRGVITRRYDFSTALLGALLGTAFAAVVYLLMFQRQAVDDALFLREVVPRPGERRLITIAALGQTAFLGLVPASLFALFEARRHRAVAVGSYLVVFSLCLFFLILDARLYLLHGRHATQIFAYAALPEGREAGGSALVWLWRLSVWLLQATFLATVGLTGTLSASYLCSLSSSRALRVLIAIPLLLGMAGTGRASLEPGAGWVTLGLHSRVLGVLPLAFGTERMVDTRLPSDPIQAELQQGLSSIYQQKFGYLFRKRAPSVHARRAIEPRPNVFLVLVESLRADVLTPELMPELHAWSRQGVRRTRHYAGTNFSESGTFTILYGLNPLVYNAVLDARVPPPLCEGLRALSYECAYYTGHPTVWWRREEFLGPATFDIHTRAQQGPWSDWDRSSLAALLSLTKNAEAGGYFGMTFLMSTHYEYRYPPEFERFLPADEPAVAWSGRDAKDFVSIANRYKNAVGFVDHLIAETVNAIDTSKSYVIVTGDHAEALGELGRVGHGFDFSDRLVHVPFVLRGPGVDPQDIEGLSLHEDIWPTVLSLVTGAAPSEHDLRLPSKRRGTLLAHCEFNQRSADALLLHDAMRVRLKLTLDAPELSVQGFEDANGKPVPSPALSRADIAALVAAFDTYLADAAKSLLVVP
jgi:Sulfatase